jgi:uncharacterized protein
MAEAQAEAGTGVLGAVASEHSWRGAWTKAPFLAFCWLGYVLVAAAGTLLFYVLLGALVHYLGDPLSPVGMALVRVIWLAIVLSLFLLGAGLLLITLTSITGIDLLYPHGRPSITVTYLFPVAVVLGRFFGVKRSVLRVSYIKVNNSLTIAQRRRFQSERILVLLPHCLQVDICNRKITNDVHNCVRCGRCPVACLLALGEKYGLALEVVNGGTLARRKVKTFRPDGIVAVACERDLMLGIQDVYPIPVYGVINDRPHGPCNNTEVDMRLVEQGVRFFRGPTPATCGEPSRS